MNKVTPIDRGPGSLSFLAGGGRMGELIRSMDWSRTPLGRPECWPPSLRTTLNLCLASNFPLCFIWGPERVQIYNDGYWPICAAKRPFEKLRLTLAARAAPNPRRRVLQVQSLISMGRRRGGAASQTASKHPHSLGQDYKECWFSAWPVIGPGFERCVTTGETTFLTDTRMFLDRNGYLEETFFTFSFSPIRDETGSIAGVFHPITETTHLVLAERRLSVLRHPAGRTADARTIAAALALAAAALGEQPLDLPFVLLYRLDAAGRQASLAGSVGLAAGTAASPERVDLAAGQPAWPLAAVVRSGGSERQPRVSHPAHADARAAGGAAAAAGDGLSTR